MEKIKAYTNYPGNLKGTLILDVEDIDKYDNPILYCDNFLLDHIAFLPKLKAVLIRRRNFLCHAAIICREMKKPSVIGVEIKEAKTGERVSMEQYDDMFSVVTIY